MLDKIQFYLMIPKVRTDRDQNDPPVDFSANSFDDYDISFNLLNRNFKISIGAFTAV